MDWQALGTIVALLGVIVTSVMAMRGQRQERVIAENAAKRSEAAAGLTEHYASRVVDALESLAEGGVGADRVKPRVRWSISKTASETFRLENTGDADAFDVRVEGHESLIGPHVTSSELDVVHAAEVVSFVAARSLETSDSTITVSWLDTPGGGDRQAWRYPLPA